MLWWRSIRARIHAYLPTGTLLEIAPGYGRWTEFLVGECQRLIGVDLTERCVDVCRKRFGAAQKTEFWVNDGRSLAMISSDSIEFAFSLDSLVHAEAPELVGYLRELARTLKPGAAAFIHHSNLGAYVDRETGNLPIPAEDRHWRAQTASARLVREACRDAGLLCCTQEIINWIGGRREALNLHRSAESIPLTDCFTVCLRPAAGTAPGSPTTVCINCHFVDEWRQLIDLSALYPSAPRSPDDGHGTRASRRRTTRQWMRDWIARSNPIVRAVDHARCPDCQGVLQTDNGRSICASCRTMLFVR
jgi:ubiquinone/menaquinone biosynthesis C-methylase UbiE